MFKLNKVKCKATAYKLSDKKIKKKSEKKMQNEQHSIIKVNDIVDFN